MGRVFNHTSKLGQRASIQHKIIQNTSTPRTSVQQLRHLYILRWRSQRQHWFFWISPSIKQIHFN